jgi:hypothetical protein
VHFSWQRCPTHLGRGGGGTNCFHSPVGTTSTGNQTAIASWEHKIASQLSMRVYIAGGSICRASRTATRSNLSMYSQKWNGPAAFPIYALYLTDNVCRNWERGRLVSFLGRFVFKRYSVYAVRYLRELLSEFFRSLVKSIIRQHRTYRNKENIQLQC